MAVAAIPLIVGAIGTAVAAVGQIRQAQAQSQAANFNAQVAAQNTESARAQARAEAAQIDRQNRRRLGSIRAAAGGAGIQLQGSVIDIIGDTVAQGELQRQDALFRGELRARGFRVDESLSQAEARNARTAGRISAASTLLQGASQAGQQFAAL